MATPEELAHLPSVQLAKDALLEKDEEARWQLVVELQRRGSDEELSLARSLFEGDEEAQRLACDVLGQLGFSRRELGSHPFGEEAAALVLRGLRSPSTDVQAAAAMAAGHMRWETLIADVIRLSESDDADVRYATTFALGGRTDDASVEALVRLSHDHDADVRNWATFGLGTQCERTDALVCDALAARIDDPHDETRGEAWAGLADKGDFRAFEPVLRSLEGEVLWPLAIQAAEMYRSPSFVPALETWLDTCDEPQDQELRAMLAQAITACRTGADA